MTLFPDAAALVTWIQFSLAQGQNGVSAFLAVGGWK
jgi:hypothetical protein